ncbi:MAG: hypothetical protein ACFFCS_10655 [Candidatus Hodarchaeota archaeon]
MTIYELGIIHEGVPLVYKSYNEEKKSIDPVLRSGFLQALNTFASEAFSDEIENFEMKNFKIALFSYAVRKKPPKYVITTYCIGDKKLNLKLATRCLTKIVNEFVNKYGSLEAVTDALHDFSEFTCVFDDVLGDQTKKAEDRVRSIF